MKICNCEALKSLIQYIIISIQVAQVSREREENLDSQALMDSLVLMVHLVSVVNVDLLDLLDLVETRENEERMDNLDSLENLDLVDKLVLRVRKIIIQN